MNAMIHELIAGGTAGAIGVAVGNPLDVIKVRMQTSPTKYFSSMQTFQAILKQEGIGGFYKGLSSPLVAQFLMNSILFATNSLVLGILRDRNMSNDAVNSFISGGTGGIAQCLILVPTDVVKCSMQADAAPHDFFKPVPQNDGVIHCVKTIVQREGISGLYKGFTATALREVPAIGIYFTTYDQTLKFLTSQSSFSLSSFFSNTNPTIPLNNDLQISKPSIVEVSSFASKPSTGSILFAGGMAGAVSWLVVYPIDVIKSNIQATDLHGSSTAKTNMFEVAKGLQRKYGWGVFTRGLGVTLLRAFPVNASVFFFYELFRAHLQDHLPV